MRVERRLPRSTIIVAAFLSNPVRLMDMTSGELDKSVDLSTSDGIEEFSTALRNTNPERSVHG